jgi:hypothetical protein
MAWRKKPELRVPSVFQMRSMASRVPAYFLSWLVCLPADCSRAFTSSSGYVTTVAPSLAMALSQKTSSGLAFLPLPSTATIHAASASARQLQGAICSRTMPAISKSLLLAICRV